MSKKARERKKKEDKKDYEEDKDGRREIFND